MSLGIDVLAPTSGGLAAPLRDGAAPCGPQPRPAGAAVPIGFKAAKRRKTPQFIRQEQLRESLRTPPRRPSEISAALMEDTDGDKLTAGVARLVFRHIAEGRGRRASDGSSSCSFVVQDPHFNGLWSEDFNHEVFFQPLQEPWRWCRRWRRCCCRRRRSAQLPAPIFTLLRDCMRAGHFSTELVVVCSVYIERFLKLSEVRLTEENWVPILLAALLLASKVFEDIHPWNVDFAAILWRAAGLRPRDRLSLYRLEAQFLKGLRWRASISGEVYAAYYFSLRDADTPATPSRRHTLPDAVPRCASWCATDGLAADLIAGIPECVEDLEWAPLEVVGASPSWRSAASGSLGSDEGPPPARRFAERTPLRLVRSFAEGALRPAEQEALSMEDLLWMDRGNPLVGSFRHAPHAEPPSRHINPRLPAVQAAQSLRVDRRGRTKTEPGDSPPPRVLGTGTGSLPEGAVQFQRSGSADGADLSQLALPHFQRSVSA